jgi:hypothetical protein
MSSFRKNIVAERTYLEMGFRTSNGIVASRLYGDIALTNIGFIILNYN